MKRVITLLALAVAAAAVATLPRRDLELQQAREDYESAVADLNACQEAQFALIEERDRWREISDTQIQTIAHLIDQAPDLPAGEASDGGAWTYKEGWSTPRGPFADIDEARQEAEASAQQYPGQTVHLLTTSATVMAPFPEPKWEPYD